MTSVELFQQVVRALQAANVDSGKFKVLLDINRIDPMVLVKDPWTLCGCSAIDTNQNRYPNTLAVEFIHNVCKDVINSTAVNKKDLLEMVNVAVSCCMSRAEEAFTKTHLPSHIVEIMPYASIGDEDYAEGSDGNSQFRAIKKELDNQMDNIQTTWMKSLSTEPHIYHKQFDIPPLLSVLAHIFISERAYKANIFETFTLANKPNIVGEEYSNVHHGFKRSIEHLAHLGLIVYTKNITTEQGHILDNFKISATLLGKDLYEKMTKVRLAKLLPLHENVEDNESDSESVADGITKYNIDDNWIISEILTDYDATEAIYNMFHYPMNDVVEASRLRQESLFLMHSQKEELNKLLRLNWGMYRNSLRIALYKISFFDEEDIPVKASGQFADAINALIKKRKETESDNNHHYWTRKIRTDTLLRVKLVSMGLVVKNPLFDHLGTGHPLESELPPFILSGFGLLVASRINELLILESDLDLTSLDIWGLYNSKSYSSLRMRDLKGEYVDEKAHIEAAEALLDSTNESKEVKTKPTIQRISGGKLPKE